jgi:hypothetical protein
MSRTKKILFRSTGGDFIDQFDTGSYIRYKAHVTLMEAEEPANNYLSIDFDVNLGDCTRVINWGFEEYDGDDDADEMKVHKVDAAIAILQKARADMVKMNKIIKQERKKLSAAKAAAKIKKELAS